jgi:hypothetical protein
MHNNCEFYGPTQIEGPIRRLLLSYMMVTGHAFILFFAATMATISAAGYPPFGFVNVLLLGPYIVTTRTFYFLFYILGCFILFNFLFI